MADGQYAELETIPYDKEIFVELLFEDDDPPSEPRTINVEIGENRIELTAFAIDARRFRTKTAFELLPDGDRGVSP
jgi:hypothetical protein